MSVCVSVDCRHQFGSGFLLDVHFDAHDSITALAGPSGSGKTTILRLIAGLLRPERGMIRIGDRVVADVSRAIWVAPEQRRVGLVFQDLCLFPHLTVLGNLTYGMKRRPGDGVTLDPVVQTLELESLLNRLPRTLSGGQQQRVALGRALLSSPSLLLLDEPLTALEPALQDRIGDLIKRVVSEFRIPALVVSHDRGLVSRLAQRVILISHGKVVA